MRALAACALCIVIAVSMTAAAEFLLWNVLMPSMESAASAANQLPTASQLFIFSVEHYVATVLIALAACLGKWSVARKILFAFGASLLMPALLLLLPLSSLLGGMAFGESLVSLLEVTFYVAASVVLVIMLIIAIINAFSRSR